ncbi:hypothetical protein QCA50_004521 [Cerrena zonata]|uniref:Uncharacterized protein n=1 Tax=Cerrena zonata TaxID=2478898 RepID=A0AAW0GHQ0_9APHY
MYVIKSIPGASFVLISPTDMKRTILSLSVTIHSRWQETRKWISQLNLHRDKSIVEIVGFKLRSLTGKMEFSISAIPILFDGGTVQDYLTKVHTFLQANPNEVVTFIFTNPEGVSLPNVWDPAFQASGIAQMAYVPPSIPVKQSAWPTLGQLIDSGKRVIVFMDAGADTDRSVPYILPEFPMIWETPFSVTDSTFPCKVDRISGPLGTTDHMYMINHSLNKDILGTGIIVSDPLDAPTTNSVTSIMANAAGCEPLAAGRAPNFVLLDYINIGQGLQAVNQLNQLS